MTALCSFNEAPKHVSEIHYFKIFVKSVYQELDRWIRIFINSTNGHYKTTAMYQTGLISYLDIV